MIKVDETIFQSIDHMQFAYINVTIHWHFFHTPVNLPYLYNKVPRVGVSRWASLNWETAFVDNSCAANNNSIQLFTRFENNNSFVWPENGFVFGSNKTSAVREASLQLFCYTHSFLKHSLIHSFHSNIH